MYEYSSPTPIGHMCVGEITAAGWAAATLANTVKKPVIKPASSAGAKGKCFACSYLVGICATQLHDAFPFASRILSVSSFIPFLNLICYCNSTINAIGKQERAASICSRPEGGCLRVLGVRDRRRACWRAGGASYPPCRIAYGRRST